jgi:hypothetical protein
MFAWWENPVFSLPRVWLCDSISFSTLWLCDCQSLPSTHGKDFSKWLFELRNPQILTLMGLLNENLSFPLFWLSSWTHSSPSYLCHCVIVQDPLILLSVAIWLCIRPLLPSLTTPPLRVIVWKPLIPLPLVVWGPLRLCESVRAHVLIPVCDVWLVHSVFTLQQDNHDPLYAVYTHTWVVWLGGERLSQGQQNYFSKGLSHEIDFDNIAKNWRILVFISAAAGVWILRRHLWFLVQIKHPLCGKC